jgi:hypothetical protein
MNHRPTNRTSARSSEVPRPVRKSVDPKKLNRISDLSAFEMRSIVIFVYFLEFDDGKNCESH